MGAGCALGCPVALAQQQPSNFLMSVGLLVCMQPWSGHVCMPKMQACRGRNLQEKSPSGQRFRHRPALAAAYRVLCGMWQLHELA